MSQNILIRRFGPKNLWTKLYHHQKFCMDKWRYDCPYHRTLVNLSFLCNKNDYRRISSGHVTQFGGCLFISLAWHSSASFCFHYSSCLCIPKLIPASRNMAQHCGSKSHNPPSLNPLCFSRLFLKSRLF